MQVAGIDPDFWDFAIFAAFVVVGDGFLGLVVLVLGLPERIAVARHHPEAEAVNLLGWIGAFTVLPRALALIWALKPSNIIDVRRWPDEVQRATEEMIDKMKGREVPPTPSSGDDVVRSAALLARET
jgi:hypothetical protein